MNNRKFILDACCGGRYFWYNKRHPNTLYVDNRKAKKGHDKYRPNHEVNPDIIMDFRNLKFPNNSFRLVVWDPPHLINLGDTSSMAKRYGKLKPSWREDLSRGFKECWRVLRPFGVLIFKFNERDIPIKEILSLFKEQPLFGHTSGSRAQTYWFCFMKIPYQWNAVPDNGRRKNHG
jgi:SAM-dependent methyltransferase